MRYTDEIKPLVVKFSESGTKMGTSRQPTKRKVHKSQEWSTVPANPSGKKLSSRFADISSIEDVKNRINSKLIEVKNAPDIKRLSAMEGLLNAPVANSVDLTRRMKPCQEMVDPPLFYRAENKM